MSLVVGDIRIRTLEPQPMVPEIYMFLFMNRWKREEKPSKIVFLSGLDVSGGYC